MKTNLTDDEKSLCKNCYLDSVDYHAAKLLAKLVQDLPDEAELMGAMLINACRRDGSADVILHTPKNYILYKLNGYFVHVWFPHLWMFGGVYIDAQPMNEVGDSFKRTRYPLTVLPGLNGLSETLLQYAQNPHATYSQQEAIRLRSALDREYVTRPRKIERKISIWS